MAIATLPGVPAETAVSPGTAFAAAFAASGERTEVTYDYTITDAHKPDRPKPRLTVRGLLKRRPVQADVLSYWCESSPAPELAAAVTEHVDHRLLVRIATAENQALTIGPHGLLRHPGIARLRYDGDYADGILAALDEIEQVGSTAHAMIVNPADFYRRLAGRGSLLGGPAAHGTPIKP